MSKKQKHSKLPAKYEPGFLEQMDRRTEVYKRLSDSYDAIIADLGGADDLSHLKVSLIERAVFLIACLKTWENQIASNPKGSEHLLSRWIQALNTLQGLTKTIGLDRLKKRVDLRSYVKERTA